MAQAAPLVFLTHVRNPNCTGEVYAYPYPNGAQEQRFDEGMLYLAEALAQRGYAALIPDLTPLYIAPVLSANHPQLPAATSFRWSKHLAHRFQTLPSATA